MSSPNRSDSAMYTTLRPSTSTQPLTFLTKNDHYYYTPTLASAIPKIPTTRAFLHQATCSSYSIASTRHQYPLPPSTEPAQHSVALSFQSCVSANRASGPAHFFSTLTTERFLCIPEPFPCIYARWMDVSIASTHEYYSFFMTATLPIFRSFLQVY